MNTHYYYDCKNFISGDSFIDNLNDITCRLCFDSLIKKPKIESSEQIKHSSHYQLTYNIRVDDIIKLVLNSELCKDLSGNQVFWFGQVLKYSLRAGLKGEEQDWIKDLEKKIECRRFINE